MAKDRQLKTIAGIAFCPLTEGYLNAAAFDDMSLDKSVKEFQMPVHGSTTSKPNTDSDSPHYWPYHMKIGVGRCSTAEGLGDSIARLGGLIQLPRSYTLSLLHMVDLVSQKRLEVTVPMRLIFFS